jgi:hypothetical protein
MSRKTLSIVAILIVVAPAAQAQAPGGAFSAASIPSDQIWDGSISIATGVDGLGLIVFGRFSGAVQAAHCSNPACSSATISSVQIGSSGLGMFGTSVAIGVDGLGLIAYPDVDNHSLRIAHCNDVTCASAAIAILDNTGGEYPSIAIGADGLALVSYSRGSPRSLIVAHCSDPACTSATTSVLDATQGVPSITIGADGLGLVAYADGGGLKVAHCPNPSCTSATLTTVDAAGRNRASMAIGADGLALIAYADNSGLRVAHCADLACTAASTTAVDGDYLWFNRPWLAIGADGLGVIAFLNKGYDSVKVAHCLDTVCSGVNVTTVGEGNEVALTIGKDGFPLIGSRDLAASLKTFHQAPRGDFNVDGRQDLVWRRAGTGDNMVWLMNGADLVSASFTNPSTLADPGWRIVGTNDFNHDAQTDLLWRHSTSGQNVVWFMNGVDMIGGEFTTPPALADTRWQMVGTGDFDRNGRPDILWRHDFSGENVLWYMNGTVLTTGTFLTPSALPDTRWRMAGVADFNRDGKPDILWHHQSSGEVVLWYMNGSVLTSGTFTSPSALPDTRWHIAAVGDYNADGRPDLVWHNDFSGQAVIWFMDNATLIAGTFTNPSTFPDTNWKVVGPR